MPMLVLIPVTFFGTLLLAFVGIGRHGFRQSFVYAATAYTLCLVCVTEIFSIWNLLRLEPLLVFWTGCTVLSVFSLSRQDAWESTRQAVRGAYKMFRASRFEVSAIVVILALVLLIAVVAPPNNWESMVYRLTRVVMWMQQGSVSHYPTPNTIQLFQPPLSAWNILHFQILSGGDRFANTVSWVALAGCGVLVSLIVKGLKQSFPTQILAAVIAVTLPMGLVQGSSSQGNLVLAFWLLAFVVFTLQYFKNPSSVRLVCCGLAFGFTLLSKGTAYVIAPPMAATLWLCGIVRMKAYRSRAKLVGGGDRGRPSGASAERWALRSQLGPLRTSTRDGTDRLYLCERTDERLRADFWSGQKCGVTLGGTRRNDQRPDTLHRSACLWRDSRQYPGKYFWAVAV